MTPQLEFDSMPPPARRAPGRDSGIGAARDRGDLLLRLSVALALILLALTAVLSQPT